MAYFDYSPPEVPDFAAGLRDFGDALTKIAAQRQQKEQAQKQLDFQREQEQRRWQQQQQQFDYQNRIENRKETRDEVEFSQRQAQRNAQRGDLIRKAVADNNPQLAQQLASETVNYDPHTGAEKGRASLTQAPAADIGAPPVMPMTPDELPDPKMVAAMRAVPGMPSAPLDTIEQQRGQDEGAVRGFEAQAQAYSQRQKDAEAARPYTLKMGPDDPGATLDTTTQRYATRNAAAQDFLESFRGVPLSQSDQAAAQNVYAQIKAGAIDPSKAGGAYDKARLGITQEEGRNTRSAGRDKAIVDAAKARATGDIGWARLHSTEDKDRRKETRGDVKDWLKASGLETAPKQRAAMDLSLQQLGSPDGRQQQAALVGMARATQGDNRFSDQDYRVFVANGGVGTLDQVQGTIQRIMDGEFGDETIAAAKRMATGLRAVFDQRLKQAGIEGSQQYVEDPEVYDPRVARHLLEQRLGKENLPPLPGGPPEVNSKRKGKHKAKVKAADDLDAAMQK